MQEHLKAAEAQQPPGSSYKPAGNAPVPQVEGHMGGNSERNQDLLKDEPKKSSVRTPVTLKVGWEGKGGKKRQLHNNKDGTGKLEAEWAEDKIQQIQSRCLQQSKPKLQLHS